MKRNYTSIDLLELLGKEKSRIQNLIKEKTRDSPKKVQLTTELKLVKRRLNEGSQKAITIFTNSDCVPVYFFGISDLTRPCTPLHRMAVDGFCWK